MNANAVRDESQAVRVVGRYAIHGELASGGMAAVHLGRLIGEVGFARTVAIKRLHTQYARDPEFVAMFLDEARLVSRIKHPNVVPTLDIVSLDGELFLVMEYVHGEPLSKIMQTLGRQKTRMPVNIAVGICLGLLEGLHAAHEAKAEDGSAMGIVHRDVSPQNLIVGADGIARVLDFGIAKAAKRIQTTEDGQFKGKIGYMPPDVLSGAKADRRADIWGATVVLWEMLVGRRLFISDESPFQLVKMIVENEVDAPSKRGVKCSPQLDAVIKRGLMKSPHDRYSTAREMAVALEAAISPAGSRAIGDWLLTIAGEGLAERAAKVEEVEKSSRPDLPSVGTVQGLTRSVPPPAPHSSSSPFDAQVITGPNLPTSSFATISSSHETVVMPPSALSSQHPPSMHPGQAYPQGGRSAANNNNNNVVIIAALIVGAVVIIGMASTLVLRRAASSPSASTPISASTTPSSAVNASSTTPTSSSASEAITPPIESGKPLATAPGATSAHNAPTASSSPTTPKATSTTHGPPKSCVPPYTIGPPPDYIRKPKLECLPH